MIWLVLEVTVFVLGFIGIYLWAKKQYKNIEKEEKASISETVDFVKNLDKQASEILNQLIIKNTITLECPCGHNTIRTFIDLSQEENTFICPECKNEYRIEAQFIPILKGKIVDEHRLYNLISEKQKERDIDNGDGESFNS